MPRRWPPYVYVRLKYDSNAFSGLPTVTADVRGRTLFDPRDGQTRYSNNAALAVRDYLTNPLNGRGVGTNNVDDLSFIAAANACDARITAPAFSDTFTAVAASDNLTFAQALPIDTGDGIKVSSVATLPTPLTATTPYYAIKTTDTAYQLATSAANAIAGIAVDITSAGVVRHIRSILTGLVGWRILIVINC